MSSQERLRQQLIIDFKRLHGLILRYAEGDKSVKRDILVRTGKKHRAHYTAVLYRLHSRQKAEMGEGAGVEHEEECGEAADTSHL